MVDPVSIGLSAATVAEIGTGATAAGGVASALGSIFGGMAGAQSAKYKAAIAQYNAQVAEQNARQAMMVGNIAQEQRGLAWGQKIGNEVVAQAASGLTVGSGSLGRVTSSMSAASKFDQGLIQWDAARRATGYRAQAQGDLAEAKLDQSTASWDQIAGGIGAFSSILGATGSVASQWIAANRAGIPGYGGSGDAYTGTSDPTQEGTLY